MGHLGKVHNRIFDYLRCGKCITVLVFKLANSNANHFHLTNDGVTVQVIRAHRVLLSAGSGYLEKVLAVTPSEHPTVVLSNIRYKELKLLVDFMYSGETPH